MKRVIPWCLMIGIIWAAIGLSGCDRPEVYDYDSTTIPIGEVTWAAFGRMNGGLVYVVLCRPMSFLNGGGHGGKVFSLDEVVFRHEIQGGYGNPFEITCRPETGRITIHNLEFDLAKGAVFLCRFEVNEPRIRQLKFPMGNVGVSDTDLRLFAISDPVTRAFLDHGDLPAPADAIEGTPLPLSVEILNAKAFHNQIDLAITCEIRIRNTSGSDLPVMTRFASVCDGFDLVLRSKNGVSRRSYTDLQSPITTKPRPVLLSRGESRSILVFPSLRRVGTGPHTIQLSGGFPGTLNDQGITSNVIELDLK